MKPKARIWKFFKEFQLFFFAHSTKIYTVHSFLCSQENSSQIAKFLSQITFGNRCEWEEPRPTKEDAKLPNIISLGKLSPWLEQIRTDSQHYLDKRYLLYRSVDWAMAILLKFAISWNLNVTFLSFRWFRKMPRNAAVIEMSSKW